MAKSRPLTVYPKNPGRTFWANPVDKIFGMPILKSRFGKIPAADCLSQKSQAGLSGKSSRRDFWDVNFASPVCSASLHIPETFHQTLEARLISQRKRVHTARHTDPHCILLPGTGSAVVVSPNAVSTGNSSDWPLKTLSGKPELSESAIKL